MITKKKRYNTYNNMLASKDIVPVSWHNPLYPYTIKEIKKQFSSKDQVRDRLEHLAFLTDCETGRLKRLGAKLKEELEVYGSTCSDEFTNL